MLYSFLDETNKKIIITNTFQTMKKSIFLLLALMLSFAAQAKVVTISPTAEGNLRRAVRDKVADGDTLILTDGEYNEEQSVQFNKKDLVVLAAEGAHPRIKISGEWSNFVLSKSTTIKGIHFDGSKIVKYPFVFANNDASGTYIFQNCEFQDYTKYAISNPWGENHPFHIDSLIIDSCLFHNGGEAVYMHQYGFENQHTCDYFKMTNTTLYDLNTTDWVGMVHIQSNADATYSNNAIIDHITIYNFAASELGGVVSGAKTVLSLTNSIIANPAEKTTRFGFVYGTGTIDHTLFYNMTSDSGTHTNSLSGDPKFVDAANGNFALAAGSPALNAATDGSNLGDTRWTTTGGDDTPGDDNTGGEEEGEEEDEEDTTVKIYVSPTGDDDNDGKTPETAKATLQKAYEVTNAGETIIVANGEYESSSITFDKPGVTVKAAKDAKPVINATSNMYIYATTTFVGLTFDGLGSAEHGFAVKENTAKNLILQDCEVRNYPKNLVFVDGTHHVDSLIIDNCLLHHSGRVAVYVAASSLMDGETPIHGCDYFQLTNSTVYEINSTDYEAGAIDIRTNGNKQGMYTEIVVDHVTIYNAKSPGDYGAIASYKSENVKISNTIVMNDAEYTHYSFRVYGSSQVSNCLSYNCSGKSGAQYANCLPDNTDPQFVDAANGDFTIAEGSPALTAGTDGKAIGDPRWVSSGDDDNTGDDNTGDDNTGDDENDEEETTTDFESRVKVYVSPTGSGTKDGSSPENAKASFASAYSAVQPGQAIVMADGIYEEAYEITLGKEDVIIKAAEGAKPVLALTGEHTSLHLTATITFDGITFDGRNICNIPIASMGSNSGQFTFLNCEFTGWVYWGISNKWEANTHVDKVIIDKCTFHDASGGAIRFNSDAPAGTHACSYFKMTNTTLYNLVEEQSSGIIHVSSKGEATGDQNEVIIDHITMYNYSSKYGGIAIRKSHNLNITNSIIANPTNTAQYALYHYCQVGKNLFHNVTLKTSDGADYDAACITEDPLFVYPEGANFNLRPGSPALNAGTDGKHLGDTRWGEAELVAVSGVSLNPATLNIETTDTVKIQAVIAPVEATNRNVTWTVADPTIVSVDNGTVIGLKAGETTITVTTEDGGFTATANVVVAQKVYHPLVIEADALEAADYTIPSYIQMIVAKEAARRDPAEANVAALQAKIDALQPYQAPYDVVVNINGDPRTNMAFTWFTNETVTDGKVQLVAKADATEADFADAITVVATTTTTDPLPYAVDDSGILWKAKMDKDQAHTYSNHKALATGLTPNTTYTYRVGTEGYWSELGTFITAPEKNNEFSFIYMSDAHIMTQDYIDDANSAARAALNTAPDAKFCAFPGDFVDNYCNSEWEWERLFEEALRPMAYQMPIVPTDGNHDVHYNPNYSYHFNTDNSFKTQASVKPYADGTTYSFMYGDVLFLVFSMQDYWRGDYSHNSLTSVYLQNDVANWFKDQVAAHPEAKLRVAMCHYNIFSGSSHQEDEMGALLRATMLPVMKECEIDFVIQGHDHCYEVMGPVDPDTRQPIMEAIADREAVPTSVSMSGYKGGTYTVNDGSMYFIGSTCGHKRYWPNSAEDMEEIYDLTKVDNYFSLFTGMFAQPDKPSFSVFTVNNRTITVDSYTANPDGTSEKFNTFIVKRTVAHTGETSGTPTNLEQLQDALNTNTTTKVLHNGQVLIVREGVVYTLFGQQVK